ncbi:MAG: thioredoxin family protein [Rhodobacteraceae bacterium]|nr:thioredoxin family protein [Paracoccaceae bacterium]
MNRRTFFAITAAVALIAPAASAENFVTYTPGLIEQKLAAGETVFVDFGAEWCSTCASQQRTINALRDENPAYDVAMTFVKVDWDDFGRAPVATSRNIPRRSTLLVLRGDDELGRIIAGTRRGQIKELMDLGL